MLVNYSVGSKLIQCYANLISVKEKQKKKKTNKLKKYAKDHPGTHGSYRVQVGSIVYIIYSRRSEIHKGFHSCFIQQFYILNSYIHIFQITIYVSSVLRGLKKNPKISKSTRL